MSITIDDGEVRRMLARLESGEPAKAGLRGMSTFLHARILKYPAKTTQRYRRTLHLQRSWGDGPAASSDGWTYTVGNTADYAPRVLGAHTQEPLFAKYNWSTTAEVVEREADAAFRTFVTGFRQAMQAR